MTKKRASTDVNLESTFFMENTNRILRDSPDSSIFYNRNEQRQLQRRPQPRPEQGWQQNDQEHARTDEEFATTFSVYRNKERQLVCRT